MTDRLGRLRTAIAEAGLDALYVSCPVDDVFGRHSQNRRYVSGFTGSSGIVLVTKDQAVLATDFRYIEQGERECGPHGVRVFKIVGRDPKRWLRNLLGETGLAGKKVGLSRADMTYGEFVALDAAVQVLPATDRPTLVPAPPIVEGLRRRKDTAELAVLQRAIDIADAAFESVSGSLVAGQLETAVVDAVEREVRAQGGSGVSFDTIVASGPWGAMPHASPRDMPIEAGQPVVIDMGALYGGYCSDLTRTVVAGRPDAKFREVYEIVFEAQRAAIAGVEPGMEGPAAHRLAHDVIAARGYGEQFGHGLGHGVGLEVHESPYLGETSTDTLEEGMVFTIEPGIYIPGWGGVRIEDVVVLEDGKARVLSHATKLTPAGV